MKSPKSTAPARRKWIGSTVLFLLVLIVSFFVPWNVYSFASHPRPVQSYEEAVKQIKTLRAVRQAEMNPDCLLQLLTHGEKMRQAIILVHGYTNCPAQVSELGRRFYDLRYNVLIAPLPHHGLSDPLNDEQGQLTARELAAYADDIVDLAHGLGEQVDMMGISGGGVTTAWAAQNRSDLNTAMIISPAFGYHEIPTRFTAPVMNILLALPDTYEWWDSDLRENVGPSHAYPRYSKHALAQFLKLGFAVQVQSWRTKPAAQRVIVVTNANDTSVNNEMTFKVVQHWQKDGADIETYEFPLNLGLDHDLLDPEQPNQQIELVYPELIHLIAQEP
jgi:carboxylesterase